jgi:hypothetical protein
VRYNGVDSKSVRYVESDEPRLRKHDFLPKPHLNLASQRNHFILPIYLET